MSSTDGSEQRDVPEVRGDGPPANEGSDTSATSSPRKNATAKKVESDWERKRRLAEIFGDVLPSTTRDERDPGSAGDKRQSASEAWLLSQVPPHHGGHG
jgi:hypothetical protein